MLVAKQNNLIYSYAFSNNSILYKKIKVYLINFFVLVWQKEGFLCITKGL